MRRPIHWLVFALSLGFLGIALGRTLRPPRPTQLAVERVSLEPRVALAVPAAFKRVDNLEFGYVTSDATAY